MSHTLAFSIGSPYLSDAVREENPLQYPPEKRKSEQEYPHALAGLEEIAATTGAVEYLSPQGESFPVVRDDIGILQEKGITPVTAHLSVQRHSGDSGGGRELTHSLRNIEVGPSQEDDSSFFAPDYITFHPPTVDDTPGDVEAVREQVILNMDTAMRQTQDDQNMSGTLCIENMPPTEYPTWLIETPEDVRALEATVDRVEPDHKPHYTFDVGHAGEWEALLDAFPAERTAVVHLYDKQQTADGWETHLPLGEGELDMDGILDAYQTQLDHAQLVAEIRPGKLTRDTIRSACHHTNSLS